MATQNATITKLEDQVQNLEALHNQAMSARNAAAMAQVTAQINTTNAQLAMLRNAQIADDDAQLVQLGVQLDKATTAAQNAMQNLANLGNYLHILNNVGQTITQIVGS